MSHPIAPYMPTVFIPVSDLKRSIDWYCELLEIPVQPKQNGGGIYYFNLGGTDIILDSNMWGYPPMIMFDTPDIDAAYDFCKNQQFAFIGEMFRRPGVAHFSVGGNMVCQAEHSGIMDKPDTAHPLLKRICRVIVHAEHQGESERWYGTFLDKPAEPDPWVDGLTSFRMTRGAHLLVDDNRLCQTATVHYDKLQIDIRVNPIAIIESPDLENARSHVLAKGAANVSDIAARLGLSFFTFNDPDGNGLMVCQTK
ncbi:VOC family protein [Paenibacillus alkalitolerans]|uniref:VOC family protein n=1 Tax=Paenibacillus alkalitolerans TaxID=2799335 RepID=UPI0018F2BB99|nr:VOC family protein [Paenibacillus alkalitolerans]